MLTTPAVWLLCVQYACLAYGWWFYVTWLPTYLRDVRGLSLMQGAFYSGLPLFLGGVGCFVSAGISPWLRRLTGSVILSRRILAITGFVGASTCIIIFTRIQDPLAAVVMLGFAGFFNDFVMPHAWAGTMDVGGRHAGTVSGAMNMFGGIAGALSGVIVGYILLWTNNDWTLTFYVSSTLYMLGGFCWLFLDASTPFEKGRT